MEAQRGSNDFSMAGGCHCPQTGSGVSRDQSINQKSTATQSEVQELQNTAHTKPSAANLFAPMFRRLTRSAGSQGFSRLLSHVACGRRPSSALSLLLQRLITAVGRGSKEHSRVHPASMFSVV